MDEERRKEREDSGGWGTQRHRGRARETHREVERTGRYHRETESSGHKGTERRKTVERRREGPRHRE